MSFGITWTCHIYKQERPDDKISVVKRPLILNGKVFEHASQNIRYCNDNKDCYEEAKNYSHLGET